MANWQEFKEHSVRSGLGTALCVMLPTESKYHILSAVESLPAVFGSPNTIEYSTTTNMTITNIPGKNSTENIEINIPYNLDNISLCNKIKGVKCKYAYIDLDDFSGQEFMAEARYHMGEVGTDSIKTIVLTLTVSSAEEDITPDLYDLYEDTVTFEDNIPTVLRLKVGDKYSLPVVTSPTTATITASSGAVAIATFAKSASGSNYEVTAVANGSCIVKIVATATGYAENQREIKVIVE